MASFQFGIEKPETKGAFRSRNQMGRALVFENEMKRLQRLLKNPLEPSYWVLLENPFHKSSRSSMLDW
jgi:hypothetical protein